MALTQFPNYCAPKPAEAGALAVVTLGNRLFAICQAVLEIKGG